MVSEPDPITEDGAVRVWTAGIHSNNADLPSPCSEMADQLIDKRAFARARRSRNADETGTAGPREQGRNKFAAALRLRFDQRGGLGESASVLGEISASPIAFWGNLPQTILSGADGRSPTVVSRWYPPQWYRASHRGKTSRPGS